MQVFYIGMINNEVKPAHELDAVKKLDSYSRFTQNSYGEFMTVFAEKVAETTKPGERKDVEEQDYTIHAYSRSEGFCGVIITSLDYPKLVAHKLLSKICDEFIVEHPRSEWADSDRKVKFSQLKEHIQTSQDPGKADNITKLQAELDETKIIVQKTVESLLERGEKLDTLVEKSNGLSDMSKKFYKTAKKQNSCCVVM